MTGADTLYATGQSQDTPLPFCRCSYRGGERICVVRYGKCVLCVCARSCEEESRES